MKIALDARMYGPKHTGIGRYVMELVNGLIKQDKHNQYVLILRKKYFESLNVPKNWKKVLADFRHYSVEEQLALPLLLYKIKPDLVHFPHLNVPILYKGKYVLTIHDMTMHWQGKDATTLPLPLYYAKRLPYKIIFKNAVLGAKHIIVPTNSVKKEVSQYYKLPATKLSAIYEGVSTTLLDHLNKVTNTPIKEPYFLYVGNVYPHKNIPVVVSAIKDLNIQGIHTKLVIVCARSIFRERLQKIVETHFASQYVEFKENVSDSQLAALYKHALAYVYPTKAEGFGLPGLEAMAAGIPVIASDIPVLREVYKNNAYYFDPTSVTELVARMKSIVKRVKRGKYTQTMKSISFAKQYSWKSMVTATIRVYESSNRL